jgi:hypothetical protein
MLPKVGATFSRVDGEVVFTFIIDSANVIGPKPATRDLQKAHPAAWAAFCQTEDVSALDRDAKSGAGGSLPADPPAAKPAEAPKPKRKYTRHQKG